MKLKEANITISITDMDRAISFYTSLGFTEKIRWQNHYAKLVVDGVILGLLLSGEYKYPHPPTIRIGLIG